MKVPERWRSLILLGIFVVGIGFLVVVNLQQYPFQPHDEEYWYEQAFWPRHAAWWSKTAMWSCFAALAVLFRRWKEK